MGVRLAEVDMQVWVAASAFTDVAGNANLGSEVFTVTSDGTGPTVTITASDSDGKTLTSDADNASPWDVASHSAAQRVTFTFTLSEPVLGSFDSGFDREDILVTFCAGASGTPAAPAATPPGDWPFTCSAFSVGL